MNFSGIKSKIITKKITSLLKEQSKRTSLQINSTIKTVGIIVNEGSNFNFDALKKLQKDIGSGSNNFHVLTYKSENENSNEFRGVFFYEKDITWNGKIKSKDISDFLDTKFDMLIDYTNSENIYQIYLVSKSKANFKVGYANENKDLYNLILAVPFEDIDNFRKELIKYLKILKKL